MLRLDIMFNIVSVRAMSMRLKIITYCKLDPPLQKREITSYRNHFPP